MAGHVANPQVLVSTDWAQAHLDDAATRFVEVDVDTQAYESGHIPGAVGWNWQTQLQDQLVRDIIRPEDFEQLLSQSGIANETLVVLYGDNNNWFAAWAYWLLKHYGHDEVRILDGGRAKWTAENRALTTEVPSYSATNYKIREIRREFRAFRDDVTARLERTNVALVDVRSPDEFTGKILAPPGLNETCQRGGHIPGAKNIPWSQAVRDDGTFKSIEELRDLYQSVGVTPDKEVITYCRIGERSSHSWVVLKELLGYPEVRNYDGSWTEWGNVVNAPIER
jgi:thiosulfate/3-mercaptopyruvate sulfurtransferase